MKFIFAQIDIFMSKENNRRNLRFLWRFSLGMFAMILLYSAIFHYLMELEGREHDFHVGLYWTITTMSTLGFGDIVFHSILGRMFSVLVLFSGVLFFMLLMPFIFIRFVYQPWLDAHKQASVPRSLPEEVRDHVLILGTDDLALNLAEHLSQHSVPHYLMVSGQNEAVTLLEQGLPVILGDADSPAAYLEAQVRRAALVVALRDNLKNTAIAAVVRDLDPTVPLVGSATGDHAEDVLRLAGYSHVFNFARMLGESMGRRVFAGNSESSVIAGFGDLCISETRPGGTMLVGRSLRQLNLRQNLGLNVVGIRRRSDFLSAHPDMIIDENMLLLLAGTRERLEKFDEYARPVMENLTEAMAQHPVLILGGGAVGETAADNLDRRSIPFTLLDNNPASAWRDDPRFILGEPEDIHSLREVGLKQARSVVIATPNDDLNIYLTIFCRKLQPDAQIVVCCKLARTVKALYGAGASLVMAVSSIASNAVMNILSPDKIFMLTEGMNIFRMPMPPGLKGKNLRDSNIRQSTRCNVVAISREGHMLVNLDPDVPFEAEDEIIIVGSMEAEREFTRRFPQESQAED
ncbi:MAG: NAD-binding protein [Deltaproteobacteria bacterium]|jgi:Trk K+ transport system NAD-binding subunit|nr:NAD-binding protein [Deltaproteobacteria bacterium]